LLAPGEVVEAVSNDRVTFGVEVRDRVPQHAPQIAGRGLKA
jgi:hypothetical protein